MSSLVFHSRLYLKNVAVPNSPPMCYGMSFVFNSAGIQNKVSSKMCQYRDGSLKSICEEQSERFADDVGRHRNTYSIDRMSFDCVSVKDGVEPRLVQHDVLGSAIARRLLYCCKAALDMLDYAQLADYGGCIGMHSDY